MSTKKRSNQRQQIAYKINGILLAEGAITVLRDDPSIPVVFVELDGERHHIRIIDVSGREHDRLDEAKASDA